VTPIRYSGGGDCRHWCRAHHLGWGVCHGCGLDFATDGANDGYGYGLKLLTCLSKRRGGTIGADVKGKKRDGSGFSERLTWESITNSI
jgi:hypothetical protein